MLRIKKCYNKTLKKVTVSQNVIKINANALKGCSNLKTIVIKSENLAFVGKNALKGIHPRAKIKVPSGRLDNYKVLFAKKG
ncbi:MAG: leucine-rich repeat protein [Eubacterium sp.]|nr:leucine-rich repeat protein [Eubacterium sp.]